MTVRLDTVITKCDILQCRLLQPSGNSVVRDEDFHFVLMETKGKPIKRQTDRRSDGKMMPLYNECIGLNSCCSVTESHFFALVVRLPWGFDGKQMAV
jgi:hypothetical protein